MVTFRDKVVAKRVRLVQRLFFDPSLGKKKKKTAVPRHAAHVSDHIVELSEVER